MTDFEKRVRDAKVTDHNPVDPAFHSETPSKSVTQKWYFDVQWSDCPDFVEEEVRRMWRDYGLGNDFCKVDFIVDDPERADYPLINEWLKYNEVPSGEKL